MYSLQKVPDNGQTALRNNSTGHPPGEMRKAPLTPYLTAKSYLGEEPNYESWQTYKKL